MDIRSVIAQVVAIQGALTISAPSSQAIKKTWANPPPQQTTINDTPAFLNEWTFNKEVRTTQGLREQYYSVRMMLLVEDADYDVASDIASAFMGALVDAFDATETLNGTCSWTNLRGADPTLGPVRRNGKIYAGLDLYLDVRLTEGKTYGH